MSWARAGLFYFDSCCVASKFSDVLVNLTEAAQLILKAVLLDFVGKNVFTEKG